MPISQRRSEWLELEPKEERFKVGGGYFTISKLEKADEPNDEQEDEENA